MRAVVVGAGRDVDRDVADDPHPSLARRTRAARPIRARSAPGRRRRAASTHGWRVCERLRVRRGTRGAPGSARNPRHAANAERDLYGERWRSGGPSGRTCHHDCPAAARKSTHAYAPGPNRPSGSDVRCSWTPLDLVNNSVKNVDFPRGSDREEVVPVRSKTQPPPRILVQRPSPLVDCGRYPAKACVGDTVTVRAEIFADGHEELRAVVKYRPGSASLEGVAAAPDRRARRRRHLGGQLPGRRLRHLAVLDRGVDRPAGLLAPRGPSQARRRPDRSGGRAQRGRAAARRCGRAGQGQGRRAADRRRHDAPATRAPTRPSASTPRWRPTSQPRPSTVPTARAVGSLPEPATVKVERERARFSSWYELFPRSWGGFEGVRKVVPQIAELGFDVLYFTPIHPIGTTNRKGENNTLVAGPGDPGSVYGIGSQDGGHEAVAPELGTFEDFQRSSPPARSTASRSRSTSRCSARPTTRG